MTTFAHGTTLTWNTNVVAKLTNINGIEVSIDSIEKTTHDSPDFTREFHPGLIEPGEVPIEGYFDAADADGQVAMAADAFARVTRAAVITFPASLGTTWTFNGFITSYKAGDAPIDGNIPFTATIKVTGKPTLAVAVSTGMSGLAISESAVVTPTFAIGTFSYVATVLTAITSVTVTPTAADHVITVTANGVSQTVTSGAASSAITLGAAGTNTEIVIKVAQANKAPKTYTILVARAAS